MNKTDCDTADNKQEKFDEISNEMKNVSNKMTRRKESIHNPQNCWSEIALPVEQASESSQLHKRET